MSGPHPAARCLLQPLGSLQPLPVWAVPCPAAFFLSHTRTPSPLRSPAVVANPDVVTSRTEREAPIKDSTILASKGEDWLASHRKHVPKDVGKLSLFGRCVLVWRCRLCSLPSPAPSHAPFSLPIPLTLPAAMSASTHSWFRANIFSVTTTPAQRYSRAL